MITNSETHEPEPYVYPGYPNIVEGPSAALSIESGGAQAMPPWTDPAFFGPKPPISPYGIISSGKPLPVASLFDLRAAIGLDKSDRVKQIWVPEYPNLVTPEEVPYLFSDVYNGEQIQRKETLRTSITNQLIWVLFGFTYITQNPTLGVLFILAFVGVPIAQRVWSLRRAPQYSPKDAASDAENTRFNAWVSRIRTPVIYWMSGGIGAIWLIQLISSFSHISARGLGRWSPTEAVGLVKSAVWQGEWWRLFTATVMHTVIWHILFNLLALVILGKIVEAVAGRAYVAIVFLFSALLGSIFSLLLIPATSVGSSGGIMGLIGFIVALGHFRPNTLPHGFLKSLLSGVGLIFLSGLLGFMIIDNAAHFGGLLGGLLIGLIAAKLNSHTNTVPLPTGAPVRILGYAATLCIAITIVSTAAILVFS